jgi:hypothetical protein
MTTYNQDKKNFINKLQDSPYSDTMIDAWVELFKDDSNCSMYLEAIKLVNTGWGVNKSRGVDVTDYINATVNHFKVEQEIPTFSIIPILVGACDEISNMFIAKEMMKNLVVLK